MFRQTWKEWLTAPFMDGISFYGRYFLLWSFHIWYKVMNSSCYLFSPLILFHWFNQVVTDFTFTSETTVILLLLKFLPSTLLPSEKETCEKLGIQTRISFFWRHKRRCSTESLHFTQCLNFSTTSQTYLSLLLQFSRLIVETCLHFFDNCQMFLNN